MSDEIIKTLNAVCDKIGIAVDWSNQNIVPYVKDLLHRCQNYLIVNDIFWVVLWLIIGGLTLLFLKKSIRMFNNNDCDVDVVIPIIISVVLCVVFVLVLSGFIVKAGDLIKSICLPEIRLFEYYKAITG